MTRQTRVVAVTPAVPAVDRTRPSISGLSLKPRVFRAAAKGVAQVAAAKHRRAPVGSSLRLTLSERATVVVTIVRKNAVSATLVRASVRRGADKLRFSGRIAGSALKPGAYTAAVTAIDGAGNRSKVHRISFRVVRR